MNHDFKLWAVLAVVWLLGAGVDAADSQPPVAMNERHRGLFQTYCQKCHGADKQEGKFRVDELPYKINDLATAARWQKVLNAMNSGEMPPDNEMQPSSKDKADLLDDLANVMVAARKSLSDQRGAITMRRLNRREYKGTLRELLGVNTDVSELPADGGNGGFDTVGSNLFMSSNQFEQYLDLGREALDEAFERNTTANVKHTVRYEAEETLKRITKTQTEKLDALERGKQWVKAVETAAALPENATIVADLRKSVRGDFAFRGLWAKIPGAPSPEMFGFTGELSANAAQFALGYENSPVRPYIEYYLQLPALDRGAYLTISTRNELNTYLPLYVPVKAPLRDYVVRVRVAAVDQSPPERRFLEFGLHPRLGKVMNTYEITGTMDEPQTIEIPLSMIPKHTEYEARTIFVREKGTGDHATQMQYRFDEAKKRNGIGPEAALWIDWIEFEAVPMASKPLPTGLAALDIALDDKAPAPSPEALRSAIERFTKEAFRGTEPAANYIDRLVGIYNVRRKAGDKHTAALKRTLSIVLASPTFLYLIEPSSEAGHRPLTDKELAVRLSYFLWGSPPDEQLRDLASRGELARPEVLAAETERLLDDPRSLGFTRPFLDQWLGLERLDFFEINRLLYPRFDDSTKLAARGEVYESFEHLLRNNGNLGKLLKADYVVINNVLGIYYGIDGVPGDAFRKVPVPPDSPRGGLLGMAAIHVMGGNGERSSPVERGAWVLRKLLNDPPPPAPANVPQITRLAGKLLTTRERLLAHQEDPQCASCHRKIDPIGFGLENFDAAGAWRTEDSYQTTDANGKPDPKSKKTWTIDPAAAFHKGAAFNDYFQLREVVASKSDDFARGFSAALVEYALGRPCGFSDELLIKAMVDRAREKDGGVREFVRALVSSKEFHTK